MRLEHRGDKAGATFLIKSPTETPLETLALAGIAHNPNLQ